MNILLAGSNIWFIGLWEKVILDVSEIDIKKTFLQSNLPFHFLILIFASTASWTIWDTACLEEMTLIVVKNKTKQKLIGFLLILFFFFFFFTSVHQTARAFICTSLFNQLKAGSSTSILSVNCDSTETLPK